MPGTRALEGRVVDPLDGERFARVEIENETIVSVTPIDADSGSSYIFPGFIDVHVYDESQTAASGVTGYLLTCGTAPPEQIATFLRDRATDPTCLGVHLEGPFINADAAGAQPVEHVQPVDLELLESWLDSDRIRLITLAPEVEGGLDAIRRIAETPVVAGLGHTRANYYTTKAAIELGARFATHIWNAMSGFTARTPGAIGTLLADERVTLGLIPDGRHLHPVTEQLTLQIAGADRIAVTSDLVPPPHERPEDGKLLGGDRIGAALVRRLADHGLEAAATMTSLTPARLLDLDDRGRIAPGYRADLALLDSNFEPIETISAGTSIWRTAK
jgi:N-acetylglucosamine-6-phosphate deacetylase